MNLGVLGALLSIGAAPRPKNLGVQVGAQCEATGASETLPVLLNDWRQHQWPFHALLQDYGGGVRTLNLCPPSPNCIRCACACRACRCICHGVPAPPRLRLTRLLHAPPQHCGGGQRPGSLCARLDLQPRGWARPQEPCKPGAGYGRAGGGAWRAPPPGLGGATLLGTVQPPLPFSSAHQSIDPYSGLPTLQVVQQLKPDGFTPKVWQPGQQQGGAAAPPAGGVHLLPDSSTACSPPHRS